MSGVPTPDPFPERQLQAITRLVDREVRRILTAGRLARAEYARDVRLAQTVERSGSYPTSGDTFAIRFVDAGFTPRTPGSSDISSQDRTAEGDGGGADDVIARSVSGSYIAEGEYVVAMWQRGLEGDPDDYGEWWIVSGHSDEPRGGCLAEDHPGRGTPFDLHLGTWDPAEDKWVYDTENTVAAIDWRYGVPYPDAGATGLFARRVSDVHGEIWETVALDCESPGECGS